ncbi:MAG: hypothetical protein AAGG69_00595 [Pseudomonadota bacterium]
MKQYIETDFGLAADSAADLEALLVSLGYATMQPDDDGEGGTVERLVNVDGVSYTTPAPVVDQPAEHDDDGNEITAATIKFNAFTSIRLHSGGAAPEGAIAIWGEQGEPRGLPSFGPRTPAPEPAPPPTPDQLPLNRIQFETLLIVAGLEMSDLEAAIRAMTFDADPAKNAFAMVNALARLRNSQQFNYADPLVQGVAALPKVKDSLPAPLADLWMQAASV